MNRVALVGLDVAFAGMALAGSPLHAQVRIEPPRPTAPATAPAQPLTHWADRLGYRSAAARTAPPEPDNVVRCTVPITLPDSLALLGGPGGIGPYDLWDADRNRWTNMLPAPTAPDTLRAQVVGADCGALPLRVWLKTGIDYLAVYLTEVVPQGVMVIGPTGRVSAARVNISNEITLDTLPAALARHRAVSPPAGSREAMLAGLSPRDRDLVLSHRVRVGMNAGHAMLSWGAPDHVNRTELGGHTTEQWVYKNGRYLYVENDVVTAVQYTGP